MIGRRAVVRRRPLLRTAAIGGAGYMAGRAAARSYDDQTAQAPPPPAPPAASPDASRGASAADQLSQLSTLHQQGALTDEEFAAAKAKILGG